MAVRSDAGTFYLEGDCPVEEAEALLSWLCSNPHGRIDMSDCGHLHTALLQVLLAAGARIAAPPSDPFYLRWLVDPAGPLTLHREPPAP